MENNLKEETEKVKQQLNYIGKLILETYKDNSSGNHSYKLEKANELLEANTKLDSLFMLFNLDKKNKQTFAKKLGVENYNDFEAFMRVLQLL